VEEFYFIPMQHADALNDSSMLPAEEGADDDSVGTGKGSDISSDKEKRSLEGDSLATSHVSMKRHRSEAHLDLSYAESTLECGS
jgi:hypothetical protein